MPLKRKTRSRNSPVSTEEMNVTFFKNYRPSPPPEDELGKDALSLYRCTG
jgi:hypothetical protein